MLINKTHDTEYLLAGIADDQKVKHITHYFTLNQKRKVIETLGLPSFVILDHYYWKVSAKSFDFSDEKVQKELGIPKSTVRNSRLKLIRGGWVFQFVYRNPTVKPTKVTLVGEKLTRLYKKNPESISQKFAEIFKEITQ